MKKVGIITLYGEYNFGNRLQNYALQEYLKKYDVIPISLKNNSYSNKKKFYYINRGVYFLRNLKRMITRKEAYRTDPNRLARFREFNSLIYFSPRYITAKNIKSFKDLDYFVVGSDQVWNPNFDGLSDIMTLSDIERKKKVAYAASFGVSQLEDKYIEKVKKNIAEFNYISVRENEGKRIIESNTNRDDVEVLIDPTMLLDAKEWNKVFKKPNNYNGEKYILNYFLGEIPMNIKKIIEDFAIKNNCKVINILDKKDPFYACGPSEFLYLEKNAFLICTDSFHSSVFAILFDRPFKVFERQDSLDGKVNMNSRIYTLLTKFKLEDRYFNGILDEIALNTSYDDVSDILSNERAKTDSFFRKALDIENQYGKK